MIAPSERVRVLLDPISPDRPAGENLRHDSAWRQLQEAAREDDPSLPMGAWERDLKRADWRQIEHLASNLLINRSKDLNLASRLGEAWLHQDARSGIVDALSLVLQSGGRRVCRRSMQH